MALEQGRFVGTYDPTEEVLLEFTVPMSADTEVFRIGWSLKGLGRTGWIAISTGEMEWSRLEVLPPAMRIVNLIQECSRVLTGYDRSEEL